MATIAFIVMANMGICMGDTSIGCDETTKRRYEQYGQKGETWDELLNRVADEANVPE